MSRTIHGLGHPRTAANATSEGQQLYGAALKACAQLVVYATRKGNDVLRERAEEALRVLLAGQFSSPVEFEGVNNSIVRSVQEP
jgi:hypothetical protein